MKLEVLDLETAQDSSREVLQQVREKYGFVPNLMGVLAHAPAALKAYVTLGNLFSETALSAVEQQVVLLTVSAANGCEYCVAAHSAIAGMQRVPHDVVTAVRNGQPLADTRLEALRTVAVQIVEKRGWPSEQAVPDFLDAGFAPSQLIEVILGVAMKTLSNYTNHIVSTPVDAQFVQSK